jgi:hypothetical protein
MDCLADCKEKMPMKTHAFTGLRPTKKESLESLQKRIRTRAYQLYEQRGREEGHDLEDWLQAESEETTREARQ